MLDAIRYLARTGCGWRMLPNDFPPWQTVYWWFRRLVRRLLFRTIHDLALMLDRELAGRSASPNAAILDSQSVKAPRAAERGYDADGRLLMIRLSPADLSDSAGAQMILDALHKRWPWLKRLFGDAAYDRGRLLDKAAFLDFTVEVIRRLAGQDGFTVLPRRWVVERSFGWIVRWRRLVRDYEARLDVSEGMIYVAMSSLLLRRLTTPPR